MKEFGFVNSKFGFVLQITALDPRFLINIFVAVPKSPELNKSGSIKNAANKSFADSDQSRINQLVSGL